MLGAVDDEELRLYIETAWELVAPAPARSAIAPKRLLAVRRAAKS